MKVKLSTGPVLYVDFFVEKKNNGKHTTVCHITDADSIANVCTVPIITWGRAWCNRKDTYNKAIGKAKALGRALADTKLSRALRLEIWSRFFEVMQTHDMAKLRR